MATYTIHPTPNPNSLKFSAVGKTFIDGGMGAYNSAEQAAADPLASRLFQIDGLADVLILPVFATVTKRPEADWNVLLPRIEKVMGQHLAERP
jgi:hypothetical protein